MGRVGVLIAMMLTSLAARAEYRAFELQITDTEKNKSRTVISILDHIQYPKYHPLNKNETIAYIDSWRCKENMSNFRPPCAKPDRSNKTATLPNSKPTTLATTTTPDLKPKNP